MKHQCPKCLREYDARLNFCPQCREPSKASPRDFAKEPVDKHEATSGPPASNVTSHMDEFFPSTPRQVQPSPDMESGAHKVELPHRQKTAKDPERAEDTPRRDDKKHRPLPAPDPRAGDTAYYRSVRTLSMAVVVGNGLMALSVIGLAFIFTFSQQRLWNTSQERLTAIIEKVMATNETLTAKLEQANTKVEQANVGLEKSNAEIAELKQKYTNLERTVKDQFAEQRVAAMPAQLTKRVTTTVAGNLTAISAKIKDRNAKRAADALKQSLLNKEDRVAIYKDYRRLLPKLDERIRAEVEDKVGKPLIGDD